MKKQMIALAVTAAFATQLVQAAPDPREIHGRMFEHLKAVRDHLVPAPVIRFVESFPPVAIPRQMILQLAQAPADVIGGGGALQAGDSETFQVAVPPPGAPDGGVDPVGIANWAEGFAVSTTQGVLDQFFPRGGAGPRRPVTISDSPKFPRSTMEEDLNVMFRILEKAAGAKADGPPTASGIALFSFAQPNSPRAFYLDGYGAMFVLNVKYPLMAPPKKDASSRTNDTNSEWEQAKEEVYGHRSAFEEVKAGPPPGEEFDAQRVENLKERIINDLANAKNIRDLKSDDSVTVVVLGGGGGGPRSGVARRETRMSTGGRLGARTEVNTATSDVASQTTLTLRARKSDIDAFAKGKLDADEFRKKVSVQIY